MSSQLPRTVTSAHLDQLIDLALTEDVGPGDVTSEACVEVEAWGQAVVTAKAPLVVAGLGVFQRVFQRLDTAVAVRLTCRDGDELAVGQVLAELQGPLRALLMGERTALNFLMRLSGVATTTRAMKRRLADHPTVTLLDTRKTTPGLRALEKAAVVAGGGRNHRTSLFDGVLIKENHISAAGAVTRAVQLARAGSHHLLRIECEVRTIAELEEALQAGADALLLDNMTTAQIAAAVRRARELKPGVYLEASGNMTAERLPEVAATGVDAISVGALTHSAMAADLSMTIIAAERPSGAA